MQRVGLVRWYAAVRSSCSAPRRPPCRLVAHRSARPPSWLLRAPQRALGLPRPLAYTRVLVAQRRECIGQGSCSSYRGGAVLVQHSVAASCRSLVLKSPAPTSLPLAGLLTCPRTAPTALQQVVVSPSQK